MKLWGTTVLIGINTKRRYHFWNNLYQVHSKPKYLPNDLKIFWEQENQRV